MTDPTLSAAGHSWADFLHIGLVLHAADGTIVFANPRALELLDLTLDQLCGRTSLDPSWDVVREDGSPFPGDQHPSSRALATGLPVRDVVMGVRRPRAGDRVWLLVHAEPMRDADDRVSRLAVTFTDISALKRQEDEIREALRASALFRRALDEVPAFVYLKDRESRYVYANAPTLRLFATDAAGIIGTSDDTYFPPDVVRRLRTVDERVLAGERTHEEIEVRAPDGTRTVYLELKSPLEPEVAGGDAPGLLGISIDITERKEAEARGARLGAFYAALARCFEAIALGVSEQALFEEICRAAVEVGGVGMAWVGLEDVATRRIVPVASVGDRHGYLDGLHISTDPGDPRSHGPTGTAFRTGEPFWLEDFANDPRTAPWREKARASGWVQSAAIPIFRGGRPVGALTMYGRERSIFTPEVRRLLGDLARGIGIALDRFAGEAARSAAEAALRENHQQFQQLFDGMQSGVLLAEVIHGADGRPVDHRYLLANRAFLALTGMSADEVVGRTGTVADLGLDPAHLAHYYRVAETGTPYQYERFNPRFGKHGEVRVFSPKPGQFALSITDITERRALEDQLRHSQKMESIGRLAGGVAHDFNNMLSVILGHTELAMGQVVADSQLHADLAEVMTAGRRSAELTRQLLAFARKQSISPRTLDLSAEVAKSLKMLRRLISEDITLTTELAQDLWSVSLDPSQLDQILANLCVNARDAIRTARTATASRATEERVTIRTANETLDAAFCLEHEGGPPGEYVRLSVRDTGCGMDEDVQSRIFEPFYTTKSPGEGTGLGLSMVFGAVRQAGGMIVVTSSPGRGSTFDIYLPRKAEHASAEPGPSPSPAGARGETLLVVEDDPAVLHLTELTLRRLGYQVLAAAGAEEALAVAEAHPGPIDLLLTDVIMPHMDGRQLSEALRARRPGLRRLFMSGYTADVLRDAGEPPEDLQLLRKPFTITDLAGKVREALGGPSPA